MPNIRRGVKRCNVKYCGAVYSSSDTSISMFQIPRTGETWVHWLRLTGDEELLHSTPVHVFGNVRVCEKHFQSSDFYPRSGKKTKKMLKIGTIPSIFPPGHQPIGENSICEWRKEHPDSELQPLLKGLNFRRRKGRECAGIDVASLLQNAYTIQTPTPMHALELPSAQFVLSPTLEDFAHAEGESVSSDNVPPQGGFPPHHNQPPNGQKKWEMSYVVSRVDNKLIALPCWTADAS